MRGKRLPLSTARNPSEDQPPQPRHLRPWDPGTSRGGLHPGERADGLGEASSHGCFMWTLGTQERCFLPEAPTTPPLLDLPKDTQPLTCCGACGRLCCACVRLDEHGGQASPHRLGLALGFWGPLTSPPRPEGQ